MALPAIYAGMMVGGAALNMLASYRKSKEEEKAALMNARLQRLQADEVLDRARVSSEEVRNDAMRLIGDQRTAIAGSGASLEGSSMTLTSMQDAVSAMTKNIGFIQRDAQWKAKQIRMGADMSQTAADNLRDSRGINLLTQELNSGGNIMESYAKMQ